MKFSYIKPCGLTVFVSAMAFLCVCNTGYTQQVALTDIEVFLDNGTVNRRTSPVDDIMNAIDGDLETVSFLTNSSEPNPNNVAVGFGSSTLVNRIRVKKNGDTDQAGDASGAPGLAPIDNMDLTILYTTDSGPLESRTYQAVTGLTNGF